MARIEFESPELHPEGWARLKVINAVQVPGKFDGDCLKWQFESQITREDGKPFVLYHRTGLRPSKKAALTPLLTALGLEAADGGFDPDDVVGRTVLGDIKHDSTGQYNNIAGFRTAPALDRPAARPAPQPKLPAVDVNAQSGVDPFSLDEERELQAQIDRMREERLRQDEAA